MRRLVPLDIRPWMLPLIVAALAVPIIGGFALAGPPLGLALGAVATTALLVLAARAKFDEPIEVRPSSDRRYRLMVVADEPVEEPGVVSRIAEIAGEGRDVLDRSQAPEVLVLAPARLGLLDRWATDLAAAREAAARVVAISIAALATAGIEASGRIGDSDPVQAITDELNTFSAREVVLVAGPGLGPDEAQELGRRLDRPVRLLTEPGDELG
jgi:hypothetical protein